MVSKNSLSPHYIDDNGSKESFTLSQAQARRQINTNQMLSDLRQSIKARDTSIMIQQNQGESLGEKLSLAAEIQKKSPNLIKITNHDNRSKGLSLQSESGQETYSSK